MAGQDINLEKLAASIKPNSVYSRLNPGEVPTKEELIKKAEETVTAEATQVTKKQGKQKSESLGMTIVNSIFTVGKDVAKNTLLPRLQDMASDAVADMADSFIYGEKYSGGRRRSRGGSGRGPYNTGKISFEDYYDRPRKVSRYVGNYDVKPVILEDKYDTDSVMAEMEHRIRERGFVTVREFYKLSGCPTSPTDNNWGWSSVRDFTIRRTNRGEWMIVAPDPIQD